MRSLAIPFTLVLSNLAAGCGTDIAGPPLITIRSDQPPALIAFRDGIDAPWQTATMATPTTFETEVHGPYLVTVVCEDPTTGRSWTLQVARVPDDARYLPLSCDLTAPSELPSEPVITGHMVQAGLVQLGSSSDTSDVADWNFQLSAPNMLYDLIAATTERIVVRRAVEVDGDLVVTPPIDVADEGTALVGVVFTAPNATPDETLAVSVDLATSRTPLPAHIYVGPAATAKTVRDSVLLATDTQQVAVRATQGGALRELRRPFRAHDATEYELPEPLGGVQWTIEHGQLLTTWTTLPPLDHLVMSACGSAADGTELVSHDLAISPRFLAETGITHIAIDTEIPGYKPAWRIDVRGYYIRELTATHQVMKGLATSSVTEEVNVPGPDESPTPRIMHVPGLR